MPTSQPRPPARQQKQQYWQQCKATTFWRLLRPPFFMPPRQEEPHWPPLPNGINKYIIHHPLKTPPLLFIIIFVLWRGSELIHSPHPTVLHAEQWVGLAGRGQGLIWPLKWVGYSGLAVQPQMMGLLAHQGWAASPPKKNTKIQNLHKKHLIVKNKKKNIVCMYTANTLTYLGHSFPKKIFRV